MALRGCFPKVSALAGLINVFNKTAGKCFCPGPCYTMVYIWLPAWIQPNLWYRFKLCFPTVFSSLDHPHFTYINLNSVCMHLYCIQYFHSERNVTLEERHIWHYPTPSCPGRKCFPEWRITDWKPAWEIQKWREDICESHTDSEILVVSGTISQLDSSAHSFWNALVFLGDHNILHILTFFIWLQVSRLTSNISPTHPASIVQYIFLSKQATINNGALFPQFTLLYTWKVIEVLPALVLRLRP